MPFHLAVDLGTYSVKITAARIGSKLGAEAVERDQELVREDGENPVTLVDQLAALDQILARHPQWKVGSTVGLVWPSSRASSHPMTLPYTDRAQLARTLPFAVEEVVPFELDSMILAWRVLSQDEGSQLLVSFAPIEAVGGALRALALRGINPKVVHLSGELLGRLATASGAVAVVDLGHTHTTVSLVVDEAVRAVRSLSVGGRQVSAAIAKATGQGIGWAAEAKMSDRALRTHYLPVLTLLSAELRAALIALEESLGVEIGGVILTGGGAGLPGIAEHLAAQLGVSVTARGGEGAAAEAMLGQLAGGSELTCLRQGSLSWRGGGALMRYALPLGGAAFVMFFLASLVGWGWTSFSLSRDLRETQDAARAIVTETFPDVPESSVGTLSQVKAIMKERTDEMSERARVLASGKAEPPNVDLLYTLTQSFPPASAVTVDVSELTLATGAITLDAETNGFSDVATIEEAVRANPRFAQAASKDPKKVKERIRFSLNIPLQDGE